MKMLEFLACVIARLRSCPARRAVEPRWRGHWRRTPPKASRNWTALLRVAVMAARSSMAPVAREADLGVASGNGVSISSAAAGRVETATVATRSSKPFLSPRESRWPRRWAWSLVPVPVEVESDYRPGRASFRAVKLLTDKEEPHALLRTCLPVLVGRRACTGRATGFPLPLV